MLSIAASGCTNTTEPGTPGVRFIAGANLSDTIEAVPLQAVVVEVRDQRGAIAAGTPVRFEVRQSLGAWPMRVTPATGTAFTGIAAMTADSRGRASVVLQLGIRAGPAVLVVTAPELAMVESTTVMIKPGSPVQFSITPADTALYVGGHYTPRAASVDRYWNVVDKNVPVTLSNPSGAVTIAGNAATGTAIGRGSVTVAVGGGQYLLMVSVVPHGTLGVHTPVGLATVALDGSQLHILNSDASGMTSWSPNGSQLAYDLAPSYGYGAPVRVSDMSGTARAVSTMFGSATVQLAPSYSPTGDWVYFSALTGAPESFRLYRAHLDGTGTELVPNASPEDDFYQSISPDGTHLVYVRRTGAAMDYLRVLDVRTGAVDKIDVRGHSPAWAPTGNTIAYVDMQAGWVIKLMQSDGSNRRQLSAPFVTYERGLAWSPDGHWLVARNSQSQQLDLIEVDTGLTLPLGYSYRMAFPAWKP